MLTAATSDESFSVTDRQSAVRHWVDALAAGRCTEGDFLSQALLLADEDPDSAWEVLALLDQLYRRRQLRDDLFKRMKLRLQRECLGYGAGEPYPPQDPVVRQASAAEPASTPLVPDPLEPSQRTKDGKRRLQPGDLLKGRYRAAQIRSQEESGNLMIEALDEVRADLPGVPQRPSGLSDEQWRWMKDAVCGNADAVHRLMASFARVQHRLRASESPVGKARVRIFRGPRSRLQLAAASVLVAVIGVGGYLLRDGGAVDYTLGDRYQGTAALRVEPTALVADVAKSVNVSTIPAAASFWDAAASATGGTGGQLPDHAVPIVAGEAGAASMRPAVLDLPGTFVRVAADQPVAKIWVRRRGSLRGPVTFYWWTEPGSAQEARDFTQIPRRWEIIADGQAGIELHVPLVNETARAQSRNFYVKIEPGASGASLGVRTIAQVEIVPRRTEALAASNRVLP